MIKHVSGNNPVIGEFKKKASTAFAKNDIVTVDASGFLVKATAVTATANILGLIQKEVLATDADYAVATYVPVLMTGGVENEFLADVGTGTATQAMVGLTYDLKDAISIDVTAVAVKVFKVNKLISGTQVLGRFVNA